MVWVITGPAGSGKTEPMLARYRQALRQNFPNSTLWLAPPIWRVAAVIRQRILQADGKDSPETRIATLRACLTPGVATFPWVVQEILQEAPFSVRPWEELGEGRLVQPLIRQLAAEGRLRFFRPLVESSGLVDLVCGTISRWKQRGVWLERFRQLAEARGMSDRDSELLAFAAWQRLGKGPGGD